MAHWRELLEPTEYFGHPKIMAFNQLDEQNRTVDVTYKILECKRGEVQDTKRDRKVKKPILILQDRSRKTWSFPIGATIGKTLESLYGDDPFKWAGRLVTLFVTTTNSYGEEVKCLRARPKIPESSKAAAKAEARPNDRTEPPVEQPEASAEPDKPRMREPGEDG
jgi:hypothetical protein